eukprot:gene3416-3881_t
MLMSGSVHYPRSTPSMWPDILQRSKDAGIDLIETYTFWNLHEPVQGQYNFEGNANITQFLDICKEKGLYVNLRIGPYVCAEWNYGGFPVWLKNIPDIVFRDYNEPYMNEMAAWMTYITNYLRPYFASNGGPIIMAQVENEYGWLEAEYGASGKAYAEWAIQYAKTLDIGVPWIMCSQDDISDAINTCNGFYCHEWIAQHWAKFHDQPAFWTENWPGWFQHYGEGVPHRPVQDVLYSVARWLAYGGSHINYYMWHGGTTFGRWTGGPFIVTSYDYDVALDEFGYPQEPKYSLSSEFHDIIHAYSHIILSQDPSAPISLSNGTEASFFTTGAEDFTFLTNFDPVNVQIVIWNNEKFQLQPWSVQLLYNNATIFDTSYVPSIASPARHAFTPITSFSSPVVSISSWTETFNQMTYPLASTSPMEQINVTNDLTDYLWYQTTIQVEEVGATINFANVNDLIHMFVDGVFVGTGFGPQVSIQLNESIEAGTHQLQVLCMTVGLVNYADHMETYTRGIQGAVSVDNVDITNNDWQMHPFLTGEIQQIYQPANSAKVSWTPTPQGGSTSPLTWYRVQISVEITPTSSFALDMSGMTRGFVYVNGNGIGRYWMIAAQGCSNCNYQGGYQSDMCRTGCDGEYSQRYYHVPNDWLNNGVNEIVIIEELFGNPFEIQLVQRTIPYTL